MNTEKLRKAIEEYADMRHIHGPAEFSNITKLAQNKMNAELAEVDRYLRMFHPVGEPDVYG
jgi:hypothetical protein